MIVTLFAYLIDRRFGEFTLWTHPVILMGKYISWFEKKYYQPTILRGTLLTLLLLCLVFTTTLLLSSLIATYLPTPIAIALLSLIASTTIASKMLHDSVKEIITSPEKIAYLVSRDTKNLSPSETHKAAIETYAENLSDGVIAPLFYLVLLGLPGAFVYKAINTLDSMVGYKNERYEKFGKFAARLDDVANFIPSRITALLILLLQGKCTPYYLRKTYIQGRQHESPNAGYPIAAMGLALQLKLGGDTSYFGKIKHKPLFGEGKEKIEREDIEKALSLQPKLDIFLLILLGMGVLL
jgi:adenosylcobinamide-phosphate synthase